MHTFYNKVRKFHFSYSGPVITNIWSNCIQSYICSKFACNLMFFHQSKNSPAGLLVIPDKSNRININCLKNLWENIHTFINLCRKPVELSSDCL